MDTIWEGEVEMSFVRMGVPAILVVGMLGIANGAQDDQSEVDFGKGVHAYYEGRWADAETFFTQAIGAGTIDPRPYYFRGLTRELLGKKDPGLEDWRTGAQAEAAPQGRAFDIGSALERVQGPARIKLERVRRDVVAQLRPQIQRESDGMVDFSATPQRAAAGADGSRSKGGTLDPRNLPDVSSLVDPTVPFQSTEAVVPPPKLADPTAEPPAEGEALPPPSMPAEKPAPSDDPFGGNSGDAADVPADEKPADEVPADEAPAEEKGADDGAGGDADEPPPAEKPADKGGGGDDPFGG